MKQGVRDMLLTQDGVAVKLTTISSLSLVTHGIQRYSVYAMMIHGGSIKIGEYKTKEEAQYCFDQVLTALGGALFKIRGKDV